MEYSCACASAVDMPLSASAFLPISGSSALLVLLSGVEGTDGRAAEGDEAVDVNDLSYCWSKHKLHERRAGLLTEFRRDYCAMVHL